MTFLLVKGAEEVFGGFIVQFFILQGKEVIGCTSAHQLYDMAGILLFLTTRDGLVLGSNIDGCERPTDVVESLVGASYCRVCLIELQGCLAVERKVVSIGDDLVVLLLLTVWGCEGKVVGQQGRTKLHHIGVEGLRAIGKNIDGISQCYRDNWYGGSTCATEDRTKYEDTC